MAKENVLVWIPLVAAALLLFGVMFRNEKLTLRSSGSILQFMATPVDQQQQQQQQQLQPTDPNIQNEGPTDLETSCTCPSNLNCSITGDAVLGGVDFVQYFTTFQLSDGSYNESEVGQAGLSTISSTYEGFQYYFLSEANKALFDASPTSYIPQFGGFCAWGISGEYCPPYPWSADCLGPSGNWGHWTIQSDKLYFFLFDEAKSKFMNDTDYYMAAGADRWEGWFPEIYSYMSTRCYVE